MCHLIEVLLPAEGAGPRAGLVPVGPACARWVTGFAMESLLLALQSRFCSPHSGRAIRPGRCGSANAGCVTARAPRPGPWPHSGASGEDLITDFRLTVRRAGVLGSPGPPGLSRPSSVQAGALVMSTSMHVSVPVPPSSQARSQRGGLGWRRWVGVSISEPVTLGASRRHPCL